MVNLETLLESSFLSKKLYSENRSKFAFQIEPALHYLFKNIAQFSTPESQISEYSSGQLMLFIKEKKLIKSDLIKEIDHLLGVTHQVKKLPFSNNQEETEKLLDNADQYLLELKMIVAELISSFEHNVGIKV